MIDTKKILTTVLLTSVFAGSGFAGSGYGNDDSQGQTIDQPQQKKQFLSSIRGGKKLKKKNGQDNTNYINQNPQDQDPNLPYQAPQDPNTFNDQNQVSFNDSNMQSSGGFDNNRASDPSMGGPMSPQPFNNLGSTENWSEQECAQLCSPSACLNTGTYFDFKDLAYHCAQNCKTPANALRHAGQCVFETHKKECIAKNRKDKVCGELSFFNSAFLTAAVANPGMLKILKTQEDVFANDRQTDVHNHPAMQRSMKLQSSKRNGNMTSNYYTGPEHDSYNNRRMNQGIYDNSPNYPINQGFNPNNTISNLPDEYTEEHLNNSKHAEYFRGEGSNLSPKVKHLIDMIFKNETPAEIHQTALALEKLSQHHQGNNFGMNNEQSQQNYQQ